MKYYQEDKKIAGDKLSCLSLCPVLILLIICGSFSACDSRKASDKDIIGYVNKEPVLASELERALSFERRMSSGLIVSPDIKQKKLDLIIDTKLIVQEAIEAGITRDEKFVAIKTCPPTRQNSSFARFGCFGGLNFLILVFAEFTLGSTSIRKFKGRFINEFQNSLLGVDPIGD